MKAYVLLAGALPMLLLHAAEPPASKPDQKKEVVNVKYSRERLDQIRARLSAQIAVKDEVENAMRSPTPEEAAALSTTAAGSAVLIPLEGGGVAMRIDASNLSLSVATRNSDGSVTVSTDHAPKQAPKGESAKGESNDR